ncbi:flagellar biosynthesis protein FlhF [Bacillus haikouensis]|nr:flagellar biosynthesis protein FlhF [[Bacillus] enclensis]MBH9965463.1 flagellar biosynthesis protein FlhF [[Bacillus] enclensis]QWC24490.1 flagellar biosynthesis protein FlhF [Bacillus haikouensis]
MKVVKYVAPSMSEAMKKVRSELGEDAVILNSKVTHTGGILGLFKKKMVEVVAAVDPMVEAEKAEMKKLRHQHKLSKSAPDKSVKEKTSIPEDYVQQELKELKNMIAAFTTAKQFEQYDERIRRILTHLQEQGLKEALLVKAGSYLDDKLKLAKDTTNNVENDLLVWAKQFIKNEIIDIQMSGISYKKKYINVIGPTGVGKTTTLAKMAAEAVIDKRMKIGFITTDTYRIAAIEQLKTYAGLLNVPVEVVYKIEDYKKAIDKFTDFDHVFIDTAGRNFREKKYVEDMRKIIDFERDMETFLVLSLTSKETDMKEIIAQFSSIDICRYIFTKLDETSSYGSMMNVIKETQRGIAYITTGQDVPEDISEVNAEEIGRLLLKGFSYERSSISS